jgi:hypothetical protein
MKTIRCVAVLLLLVLAVQIFQQFSINDGSTADQIAEGQSAVPPNITKASYFRGGQWRADARTLIAALDFLLRPESGGTNNISVPA